MNIFDDVKQALNIREVLEYYGVNVDRAGKFVCPFHSDHKPSAGIKNDYFHCFACGAGGDVITFTAKFHGLSNYEACKKLAADFGLSIATEPQTAIDRLRADRERAKRQEEQKKRAELEELTKHTGRVLAEYHRYLYWGRRSYPFGHEAHTRSLQWLEYAEFLYNSFDENPEEFSIKYREQVAEIENRLHQWNNENE